MTKGIGLLDTGQLPVCGILKKAEGVRRKV